MTDIAIPADVGKRRRLPAWMLPKNSADDEVGTSGAGVTVSSTIQRQSKNQDTGLEVRSIPRKYVRAIPKPVIEGSVYPDMVKKVNAKGKFTKRRYVDEDSSVDSFECEIIQDNENGWDEATEDEKATVKKKPRRKERTKKSKMMPTCDASENEVELTVVDLVCIAKQYVAGTEKQRGSPTVRPSESEFLTSDLLPSSKINNLQVCQSIGISKTLGKCTAKNSMIELNEKESLVTEDYSKNIARTGEAAKDMLDLLLGPLLRTLPAE